MNSYIEVTHKSKQTSIKIVGKFTFELYKDFTNAHKDKRPPGWHYIIDFSETKNIDSSALGMLLLLNEKAKNEEIIISLTNANSSIQRIFKAVIFDKLFHIT